MIGKLLSQAFGLVAAAISLVLTPLNRIIPVGPLTAYLVTNHRWSVKQLNSTRGSEGTKQ
jgi:hypothetical protein